MRTTFLAITILIASSSCHRYYTSSSFAEKSSRHKIIAILPPQIVVSGTLPNNLTTEDIERLEEKESKIFLIQ